MITNLSNPALEQLSASADLVSLRSALQLICSDFGTVKRLDVVMDGRGDAHQALCFLRMDNAEAEQQVSRFLEIAHFAGELVVTVDLPTPTTEKRVNAQRPALRSVGKH